MSKKNIFAKTFVFTKKISYLCTNIYSTMEKVHQQAVNEFTTKLERLIFLYENAQKRVQTLEAQLAETQDNLLMATKEIVELRANYNNLKMARMVGFSEADKKKAYRRISNFVQEIDNCLELLKD